MRGCGWISKAYVEKEFDLLGLQLAAIRNVKPGPEGSGKMTVMRLLSRSKKREGWTSHAREGSISQ